MNSNWEIKKLSDVCNFQNGFAFKSNTFRDSGTPVVRITNIKNGKIDISKIIYINPLDYDNDLTKYEIINNDLLIAMSGATTGKIGVYEGTEKLLLNQRVGNFKPKNNLLKEYLFYFLSTKVEENLLISVGSAQPNLSTSQINNFLIPIPSLEEQKQIVEILDTAFEALEKAKTNLEKNLKNTKELFDSKLNEIFSQKGEGWEEKTLGEVCSLFQGLAINAKTKHLLVEKSSLPLLRIKDLRKNTHEQYVSETGFPINALVSEDEILYTRTGNSLGLVFRGRKGILHNNSFKVIPNKELTNDYLYWWLQHDAFTNKIVKLASKAAQPDITHKLFKEQEIIVPPIDKQKEFYIEIVKLNEYSKQLEQKYQQKLDNLEELKKSLLQKAFSGELTN